jgi:membrane protease YdiL (CAAX protease family)
VILAAALVATFLLTRFVNRKPFSAVGFQLHHTSFRDLGIGVLLGFLMMAGIFLVLYFTGKTELFWKGMGPWGAALIAAEALLIFGVAALFEELVFRGYPFQTLMQGVTFLPAALLVSVLFALAHWNNPNATTLSLINICLAGLLFSFAYLVTRGLWLPFGIHLGWNFSQTVLFGFPTSGLHFERYELFTSVTGEPAWVTGGSFGPEGGVLATVALTACLWFVVKAPWLKAPAGITTLDSVEDLLPRIDEAGGGEA